MKFPVSSLLSRSLVLLIPFLLSGCKKSEEEYFSLDTMEEAEKLISEARYEEAAALEREAKASAADSTEWHFYNLISARRFSAARQADSLLATMKSLSRFLAYGHPRSIQARRILTAESLMQHGVYESHMTGRADKAVDFYLKADSVFRLIPDTLFRRRFTVLLTNEADAYKQLGKYDKCILTYMRALEINKNSLPASLALNIRMGIATAYAAMGQHDESRVWWEKAALLKQEMKQTDLFNYLNNRGNDYFLQRAYPEALTCFRELSTFLASHPDMAFEKSFCQANLSDVLIHLGRTGEALPLLDSAETFFRQKNLEIPLFYAATQRISLALAAGNAALAERIHRDSPVPSWMIPEQKILRMETLLKLYEKQGQWHTYATTQKLLDAVQDSIADEKTALRISAALLSNIHEREMLIKQQELEEKSLQLKSAMWIAILLAVVAVALLVAYIQSRRARRLKEIATESRMAELRMQTVRNRITPHFICNALTFEMERQQKGTQPQLDQLVGLLHRGMDMTLQRETTLADELAFIRFYCNIEGQTVGSDFYFDAAISPKVDASQVRMPAMTLQILVENAIKHGLRMRPAKTGEGRGVVVKAELEEAGCLIKVVDNGAGISPQHRGRRNTGLKVLEQTIDLLNIRQHSILGRQPRPSEKISFSIDNRLSSELLTRPDTSSTGCTATIFLPSNFSYSLK